MLIVAGVTNVAAMDYHIDKVNYAALVFLEIVNDYNQIYGKEESSPKFLLKWLTSFKHALLKENKAEINIEEIKVKFRNLNRLSIKLYNFNDGFTAEDYIRKRCWQTVRKWK